ncbi:hypothetical protein HWV01_10220 [Moritella sp. 5]|uniref:hypothetical protein n=1 Tax=Moritella sp. 5 TaxID=2746231 RepID=UPI001BA864B9|nr:hypothetical protein [Moritella sp. 5]QUM80626.1 hypothetical protein HWV01_10220 [Moritella sp. 5]
MLKKQLSAIAILFSGLAITSAQATIIEEVSVTLEGSTQAVTAELPLTVELKYGTLEPYHPDKTHVGK